MKFLYELCAQPFGISVDSVVVIAFHDEGVQGLIVLGTMRSRIR